MAVLRAILLATLAAALGLAGGSMACAAAPGQAQHRHHSAQTTPRHRVVAGTVVAVNYGMASMLVATPSGVVPVAVTPTTSIFRGSGFASFAEVGRGMHVTVDASQSGGRLIAQIIRIR